MTSRQTLMSALRSFFGRFESAFAGFLLFAGLCVVFGATLGRVTVNFSFSWSDEVARYLLVWITFIGAAAVTREDSHIRVEFFLNFLGRKGRIVVNLIIIILSLIFTVSLFWFSLQYVIISFDTGIMTAESTLSIPKWTILTIIPLAYFLMSLHLALKGINTLRQMISSLPES